MTDGTQNDRESVVVGQNALYLRTPPTTGMAGIRFVGVSPQQAYKKQTLFGGLIPTYFAGTSSVHKGGVCHPEERRILPVCH